MTALSLCPLVSIHIAHARTSAHAHPLSEGTRGDKETRGDDRPMTKHRPNHQATTSNRIEDTQMIRPSFEIADDFGDGDYINAQIVYRNGTIALFLSQVDGYTDAPEGPTLSPQGLDHLIEELQRTREWMRQHETS